MVKNALVFGQSTLFTVKEKLKQSENQPFQATIAMILEDKTQFQADIISTTFKTYLRMWPQFVC